MRVLNLLLALHESTKSELQQSSNIGLSKRMFVRPYEINRIGKNYDDINRNDVSTEMILVSYLARKIFINEKYLRGRYYIDDLYHKELEFTRGLWKIFCIEVFGETMPELPVPTTYDELESIFMNSSHHKEFSLYNTAREAVLHNQIQGSTECTSLRDFDLFCSLPGIPGWTSVQHGASLVDGREEAPQRLIQVCMGMFKYDHLDVPEPYPNFWKERAMQALKKALSLYENAYIVKFRNGTMYDQEPLPLRFVPVKEFNWNVKRA